MKLAGKVVVVTGSTRGIGRAIVEACARAGAAVVVSSRRQEAVDEAVASLRQEGLLASGIAADVTRPENHERLLAHALETWGKVDVWVNNAGVASPYEPVAEASPAEMVEVVNTNLLGTLYGCRTALAYFNREERGGILVNMSGRGGQGRPVPFLAPYAATKAAVVSLTKSLAAENKRRPISIHAVGPGMVATDLYRDVKHSPQLANTVKSLPYVLRAVGVPVEEVGRLLVDIAAQQPGKETGKFYSLFKGRRLLRGIALLSWYRLTRRIKD